MKRYYGNKQGGMTFLGFVFVAAIALCLVFAGIQVVPAYIEHSGVKNIIKKIGSEPNLDGMSKKDIIDSFRRGAEVGYVAVIKGEDLQITKDANGKQVVSVEYQVVKPLAFNLSALMEFKASTAK